MTIVLDSTVGGASANAYEEIAYIDDYATLTVWAVSWAAKDDDQKLALAIRATRALDVLPLRGYPTTTTQALQVPRTDVITSSGVYLDCNTIPEVWKRAWAHTAAYLSSFASTVDPFSVDDTSKLQSLSVGPISLAFRQSVGADGGTFLATVIAPMLRPFGLLGSAGSVRLVR